MACDATFPVAMPTIVGEYSCAARIRIRTAMGFEYLIGLRYLRARRRERFVSLIAIISLAGVALGTFVLTIVLSVMSGFQEDLRQRLLAFNPHVTVESSNAAAADPALLMGRITA